jgi:hypothetical protein
MKLGQSAVAQCGDDRLHLRDIANQPISITGYEQRPSDYGDGTYLILAVIRLTDPEQREVKVIADAAVIVKKVPAFFEKHPTETLECVMTKRQGRDDREYWWIMDPDQYERERATRTERSPRVAATDV